MNKSLQSAFMATACAFLISPTAQAKEFTGWRMETRTGYDVVSIVTTKSGAMFGAGIGYDTQSENLIYGLEANIDYSSVNDGGLHARRDIELSARIGTLIDQHTLVYAKAGYTNAGYTRNQYLYYPGYNIIETGTYDGYRIGAGIEHNFSSNWYSKLEYRYAQYERAGANRNQAIVGLGYRF